jgi:hypothetical protein
MSGPENYGGDVRRFFLAELRNARASGQLLNYRRREGPSARLEYFREQDLTTGVVGLYGCTSIIVVSKGAVWVSHFWEDPDFTAQSFLEFRKLVLTPLIEGSGSQNGDAGMPGLGGFTGPGQPFEALYEPRALIVSVRREEDPNQFRYSGKINIVELKLKSIMPNIPITTYKYRKNREEATSSREPNGKILIQYSATEPNCQRPRKYRIWVQAQNRLEESWPAAEGLPDVNPRDVNSKHNNTALACRGSSTITSSDYSTGTPTSSSTSASTTSSSASATATLSTSSTTSSAATSAPSRNASCVASGVVSDMACAASIVSECPAGPDGVQRCLYA